ncbi:hypothetical protein [Marinagarivorans algicola]|nr:hypothetical protein [Marinagarivorans algicola]
MQDYTLQERNIEEQVEERKVVDGLSGPDNDSLVPNFGIPE